MSRIDDIFHGLKQDGRTALMPFVTAGHPTLAVTEAVLPVLEEAGASVVEIGFPFSDPIADGPVIAATMHEALRAGVTPEDVFQTVRAARKTVKLALIAMVSHSIVQRMGPTSFIAQAAECGFDGLIIPDLDTCDAPPLVKAAVQHDLSFSLLVAPSTSRGRLAELAGLCRGFVYVLARAGITGEQAQAPQIGARLEELRAVTDLPLAVGFGISGPEHVHAVTEHADAAIVGSALVRRMGEADDPVAEAGRFVGELAGGLARHP